MRRYALVVVVIAAVCGAVLAGLSTAQHFRILKEGFEQPSYCAISETINCDVVNASSYSVFLGVPIGWWGVIFYLSIGSMALCALLSRKERRSTVAIAWFMSLGSVAYSVYLAYIAIYVLGAVCLECLGMYAVNLVFAVFLFLALRISVGGMPRFVRDYIKALAGRPSNLGFSPRAVRHAIAIAIAYALGWLIIANVQARGGASRDGGTVKEKVNAYYIQSEHAIEADPGWAAWGNPDAKVTIVEFSEYQCPFCRLAAFNIKPYLQEFKRDIRYYFVNYPLDDACNEQMSRPMHRLACFAAKAGICAQRRGDFWSFHDDLFRNQQRLSKKFILGLAGGRGWSEEEFSACIESAEVDARLKREIGVAQSIYVNSTPSIFLDKRKLRYWRDPRFLQAIVREEIKRIGD